MMWNDVKVVSYIKITYNLMVIWSCNHNIICVLSENIYHMIINVIEKRIIENKIDISEALYNRA